MSRPENFPNPDHDPSIHLYDDVVNAGVDVLDLGFEYARMPQSERIFSKIIELDTVSLHQGALYSGLMSKSGAKAESGIEMIYVKAKPLDPSLDDERLIHDIRNASGRVFDPREIFYRHETTDRGTIFSRVDASGIYPWVPNYLIEQADNEDDPDISIEAILESEQTTAREVPSLEQEMYAFELLAKTISAEWKLIPFN